MGESDDVNVQNSSLASISTDPQMVGLTLVLRGETPANWAVADIGH